jgi:N,N'-diacetyllegionaminate synthase
MPILIIAEAGVNHNGDLRTAKAMVDVAARSGANYVKFQTFNAEKLATSNSKIADYQKSSTNTDDSQLTLLRKLEITKSDHLELIKKCNDLEVNFLSTAFDIESADMLHELGQEIFKIPSGEITNLPYLRHIGSFKKEIILSTGASTLKEIEEALKQIVKSGTNIEKITVMHCTSAYPALMDEVNLSAMQNISKEFGVKIGYSDHTMGIEVAIAAAALGASVIEKHFTLDRNMDGPDHKASLEPHELTEMIKGIRNIEVALGNGIKAPTMGELENINFIRKSIVAKIQIKKGDIFSEENLTTKRPLGGISPMQWDSVVGQISTRDYKSNEMIQID